jgi:hypothetical protein
MSHENTTSSGRSWSRSGLLITPFLALGLGEVALLLYAGFNPLWAVIIIPPILFMVGLGWLSFTTGFDDR